MLIIGATAISQGDPNLLTYGFDSSGYLCGTKPDLFAQDANATGITAPDFSKREVLHYFNPSQYSTMTLIPADSVCLEACPTTTIASGLTKTAFTCDYYGRSGVTVSSPPDFWATDYYDKLSVTQQISSLAMSGPCYPNFVPYTPVMNSVNAFFSSRMTAASAACKRYTREP